MNDYLQTLNEPQLEAVLNTEGPCMLIAGAGSGKTRVLTFRIANLINAHDVDPFNILALTFTNKAAKEMRTRIEEVVGALGIYEMMMMDDEIRQLVLKNVDSGTIKKAAVSKGMRTLMEDGARKILRGQTSIAEVLSVTQEDMA